MPPELQTDKRNSALSGFKEIIVNVPSAMYIPLFSNFADRSSSLERGAKNA